jgi:hypothetical protein
MTKDYDNVIGIRELGALTLWVRSVVGRHYHVTFEENLPAPCIDGAGNMKLPLPHSRMTKTEAIQLRGYCIHETSHAIYQKDAFEILKTNPIRKGSPLGFIFNMNLDAHCETLRAMDWPGDAKALSELGAIVGHKLAKSLTKNIKDADEEYLKILAVMYAAVKAESSWNIGMALGFRTLFDSVIPKDTVTLGEELLTRFNIKQRLIENPKDEDGQSIFDLSKEMFTFLFNKDPEDEKPRGGGEGSGSGAPKDTEDDSPEEETLGQPNKKPKIEELLLSDHYKTVMGEPSGMGFDLSSYKRQAVYTPIDFGRFQIVRHS